MQKLTIHEPKWKPVPSIGISEGYMDDLEIKIDYRNASGELKYPDTYFISWDRLKYYKPLKFKRGMPMVRIVPITMLEIKT
jgi:hypothetical protein